MNLATITMDKNKAREAFLDYRRAVRERHNAEDEQIMRGYRELSRGKQLIHLHDTIRAGGVNKQGLPALAVSRADRPWSYLDTYAHGNVRYAYERWPHTSATRKAGVYSFTGVLPEVDPRAWGLRAMVPNIPPALRPAFKLSNYVILWEVEKWEKIPRPPGDPALLKPIGGELYAVLATWDLTELERAVLSGRTR